MRNLFRLLFPRWELKMFIFVSFGPVFIAFFMISKVLSYLKLACVNMDIQTALIFWLSSHMKCLIDSRIECIRNALGIESNETKKKYSEFKTHCWYCFCIFFNYTCNLCGFLMKTSTKFRFSYVVAFCSMKIMNTRVNQINRPNILIEKGWLQCSSMRERKDRAWKQTYFTLNIERSCSKMEL